MGSVGNSAQQPLKALVVGAGIAGLTAAVGLRRQGHEVVIFERSALLKEYGAAVSLAPNAGAVLRRLGVFLEEYGGVPFNGFKVFEDDTLVRSVDREGHYEQYKQPFHLVLRQDLHRALKKQVVGTEGEGKPATLQTSAKVVKVDVNAATVTLEDGRSFEGDVVIGADGVHSYTRRSVHGAEDYKERPFGSNIYRCLIPTDKLSDDPLTKPYVDKFGYSIIWTHPDPKSPSTLLMYPCEGGKTLNMAAGAGSGDYFADGTRREDVTVDQIKSSMRERFGQHSKSINALINHIDSVGVWAFTDMDKMPTIVDDKLAVIGDAAHPFLPFIGQGACMAMEDAASIASLLPIGTAKNEVPARLRLYEQARYERAHHLQQKTRDTQFGGEEHPIFGNAPEFATYIYSHDAWAESEKLLSQS